MVDTVHIHCKNLHLINAKKTILRIDDAQIPIKNITCVVGPNGSGKSSLLKAIAGLIHRPKECIQVPALTTCMVLHESTVLKMSVKENLLLLKDVKKSIDSNLVDHVLGKFQLMELSNRPAPLLSSGERQRLALARAYLLNAQLILLDEPTSSLDVQACELMEKFIREMAQEGTRFLIVSHDIYQVKRLGQFVVCIENSQIQAISSIEDYLASKNL